MRDSFRHLEVQSVQPAAKLATKMQCSYEKYDWAISESFPSSVQKKWLAEFDVVDFKTHCEIPPSNLSGLPDNAFIGQYVMMIFPPLYRKNTDDNEPYVLVAKGRCVVKHPHKNRSRRHSSRRWPSVISK